VRFLVTRLRLIESPQRFLMEDADVPKAQQRQHFQVDMLLDLLREQV